MVIAVYLSIQALSGDAVAGCGGDAGCGAVLASPWSKVGPLPVSVLGAATYLLVLVGLGLRGTAGRGARLGDALLLVAAPAMLVAAGWFTFVQLVIIGELCPYCMADHALGVVLAGLIACLVLPRPALKPALPIALGFTAVLGLIAIQHLAPTNDTRATDNFFADRDGDTTTPDGKRHVSMFGGDLQFVLQDQPYLGDPHADQVVGLVLDYACPHCRAMHMLLDETLQQGGARFVLVTLPITIDEQANPYIQSDSPAFDDSEQRALLSLSVAAIDREKWQQFDRWLFAMDSPGNFPRSAKDARAKAEQLVGTEALNAQLTGDALQRHRDTVSRNIELLSHIDPPRYIPVVTTPGAPRHLTERFYDIKVLNTLLDQAKERLRTSPSD